MNIVGKTFLSLLALVGVSAVLCAQEKSEIESSGGIILKNFPSADVPEAIYKNVEKNYFFEANGACEFRQKTELRINTLFAMNEVCGETFIVYNPKFQRIKINAAYTIMADGSTRVDVPENAFNTVLPRCAADAPAFNFLRELVITHTALEPGATIFLDYSVFSDATCNMVFDEYADMPLPCERLVMNFNGSSTEYFDVPARSREKYFTAEKTVPVIYPGMPAATLRDFGSTENVRLGAEAKLALSLLLDEEMSDDEKKAAIIRFVRDQIANIPIPSTLLLESDLREPDAVLKSAYGTPHEKARLLWAMLSESLGNDFKIIHSPKDDEFWIESISGERISVVPKENILQKISLAARCEIVNGKEIIRGTAEFDGADIRENADSVAKQLIASEPVSNKCRWLPEKVLLLECSREFSPRSGTWLWRVPVAKQGIASTDFETLPEKRKANLRIPATGTTFSENYVYTIQIPEGWALAEMPGLSEVKNSVGCVQFHVTKDGAWVGVRKHLNLTKTEITPEEYPEFRTLMRAWFEPENNRLLFVENVSEPVEIPKAK